MKQGSPEWHAARCGLATCSRFSDVLSKIKSGGEAATRRNYRAELIAERLTGVPADHFQSVEMRWGTEQEPFARIAYEARGNIVEQIAFIRHHELMSGGSPDGQVGHDGQVEIKCPNTATHIDTLLKGMSAEHIPQLQGNLWMSGRRWCDFISYDPRMPERMQLYVLRVRRDDKYIAMLEAEVRVFLNEVEKTIADLEAKLIAEPAAIAEAA